MYISELVCGILIGFITATIFWIVVAYKIAKKDEDKRL